VADTLARSFFPVSIFSKDDFPTLDRPMKAHSGIITSGHSANVGALISKVAVWIRMVKKSITRRLARHLQHSPIGLCLSTGKAMQLMLRQQNHWFQVCAQHFSLSRVEQSARADSNFAI
jgi:hypothetical protein